MLVGSTVEFRLNGSIYVKINRKKTHIILFFSVSHKIRRELSSSMFYDLSSLGYIEGCAIEKYLNSMLNLMQI